MSLTFSGQLRWRFAIVISLLLVTFVLTNAISVQAAGTVNLITLGSAYTQDFDTLAASGTVSTVPTGWDFSEAGSNANTTYAAGDGSGNGGNTYSFGTGTNTDRAFGGLQSSSLIPTLGASFTNNTGGTITSLAVSYTGEQWRAGVTNRGSADRLDFQISTDATSLTTGTWTNTDTLDFSSPNINATSGALVGNNAGNNASVSATISALSIANGSTFWIRWTDFNISGADDGLAVDNFSLTPDGGLTDTAPTVTSTTPANGASGVLVSANLGVTFSEAVTVTGTWFDLTCTSSGNHTAAVSGGPTVFTLDPDTDFNVGENCTLTIYASAVTDQDGTADAMASNATATFNTNDLCSTSFTPIYSIQGSGTTAAITGAVVTKGVVVGDYEGASPALQGFYIQDATGDADTATSDGIFVFNGSNNSASLGDLVLVSGTVTEYQEQTEITAPTVTNCGTGTITPVDVSLPFASSTFPERYEGMLVRLPQTLYVTEIYQLGRFGQVLLSSGTRLSQPTNVTTPGAAALAVQAQNDLNQLIVDDATNTEDPDPIVFGRGGAPLSASNTLRGGDTVTSIVGVMTYTWGGHSASPNAYRVRPINALGGGAPNFVAANPRPASVPSVGGAIKVVGMNLLNYFNTFGTTACTLGVGGGSTECRGAENTTEFTRQTDKTVAAIVALNPDVLAVNEIENDGYGATSAIQDLVDRLNGATLPNTYAFINADSLTSQTNALGTDAIKVGILYKPAVVTPVGTAALNSTTFVNGGDSAPRNRPSLAQAFQASNGERFVVDANHLKSKGSACDTADQGDGQANCSIVRTNAANALVSWLATDPTGAGDTDILILGDLNSYAQEDPISALTGGGFTNLIHSWLGAASYSYVFDGQWGYLDYALGSNSILTQITGVGHYHINSDEPTILDYNTNYKSAGQLTSLYAPDQFRVSDHDPVIVGLNLDSSPTAVTVTQFKAAVKANGVQLKWRTDNEVGLSGFRVWRKDAGSKQYLPLDASIIPARNPGLPQGEAYTFVDTTAVPGRTRYKLEVVLDNGKTSFEGPVKVKLPGACVTAPAEVSLLQPQDGAILDNRNVTLKWQPQACAKTYEVVVRRGSASGTLYLSKGNLVAAKLQLKQLKAGTFVWQVRACSSAGCGDWSAWHSFEIKN